MNDDFMAITAQKNLFSLTKSEIISILKEELDILSQVSLNLVLQLRKQWDNNIHNIPEYQCIAQCIVQMELLKAKTLLQMSNGVGLSKHHRTSIVDFSSMLPVLRSMYELCFMFHNIFVSTETEAERDILLSIWKIRGLNTRQELPNVPDNRQVQLEEERNQIELLKGKILDIMSSIDISEKANIDLMKLLKYKGDSLKGLRFVKNGGRITDITSIHYNDGVKELPHLKNTVALYKWTSMHTHASYLSVIQFGTSYNNNDHTHMHQTILSCAYAIMATVLNDFCKVIPNSQSVLNEIDPAIADKVKTVLV